MKQIMNTVIYNNQALRNSTGCQWKTHQEIVEKKAIFRLHKMFPKAIFLTLSGGRGHLLVTRHYSDTSRNRIFSVTFRQDSISAYVYL